MRDIESCWLRQTQALQGRCLLDARVLAELEQLAGRTACERASDSEIARARDLHERMLEHYRSGERMPYYKLNQEFHSFIASFFRTETLCEIQGNIMARLKRIRYIGNSEPEHWRAAV